MANQIHPEKLVARVRAWASDRPDLVSRRAPTAMWASRGMLASIAGAGLVVVVVGSLLLLPRGGSTATPSTPASALSPSATSAIAANATPSATWTPPWLTPTPGSPTPGPTPSPTLAANATLGPQMSVPPLDGTAAIRVNVVAQGPCSSLAGLTGAKGLVYFECNDAIYAFDLATNKIAARYTPGLNLPPCQGACVGHSEPMVLDSANRLWLGNRYIDLRSGASTQFNVLNSGGSYIDAGEVSAGGGDDVFLWNGVGTLSLIHPSQVRASSIPLARQAIVEGEPMRACQSTVIVKTETIGGDLWTRIERPFGYAALEPGLAAGSFEAAGACWLLMNDKGAWDRPDRAHAIRLGASGLDLRSPEMPLRVEILHNTLWAMTPMGTKPTLLQRINLTTWRPEGAVFRTDCLNILAAGGSVWCSDGATYVRLDLPLDHVVPAPTATPAIATAPTATPEATPEATPAPSSAETP